MFLGGSSILGWDVAEYGGHVEDMVVEGEVVSARHRNECTMA